MSRRQRLTPRCPNTELALEAVELAARALLSCVGMQITPVATDASEHALPTIGYVRSRRAAIAVWLVVVLGVFGTSAVHAMLH